MIAIYAVAGIIGGPVAFYLLEFSLAVLGYFGWILFLSVMAALVFMLWRTAYQCSRDVKIHIAGLIVFVCLLSVCWIVFLAVLFGETEKYSVWLGTLLAVVFFGIMIGLITLPVLAASSMIRRSRKGPPNPYACPSCDYDLEHITSSRCPECGEENTVSRSVGEVVD